MSPFESIRKGWANVDEGTSIAASIFSDVNILNVAGIKERTKTMNQT